MLSNTAVPKYYGRFRDAVIRGEIPVCKEIVMEMNRIDELIRNPRYYYDGSKIDGYISFCEKELTLTDGSPLVLLDTFKLWAEQLFCWFYFVERSVYVPAKNGEKGHWTKRKIKKRLINKQFLIIPRSGAKTLYAETIQFHELLNDPVTTQQIVVAPTMKQAEETLGPMRTAIVRARGPLIKFLTIGSMHNTRGALAKRQLLASTKKGIENFLTNSIVEVRPMSIDALQGLKCKVATIDEWLSCDIREDVVGSLEQSASKNKDWIIIATSSEGTVRNGIGDSVKMELMKILKGEYNAPNVSIWYYKLDSIDEVGKPEMWLKAQPNLGATVTYETYQLDVERAEKVPSARNDILAKRFNIPLEGLTYFFTYEETKRHPFHSFNHMPCSMGIDLSQGDDFCAFTFLFPLANGCFGVKTKSYISSLTLGKLPEALRLLYQDFIVEGSLVILEGNIIDLDQVYDDLDRFILDMNYDVRAVGFDPYNAAAFIERWARENGPFGIVKVIQGMKTETVPLGEIKKLASEKMLIFDEKLMQFAMGNSIVQEDTNGNRKLLKRRREEKIDNVSALMDSLVAYKNNKDMFL